MSSTYENPWINQIVDLQHTDGSWGAFHSLSRSTSDKPITTEQALRRLRVLGLSKSDPPIASALQYMRDCLSGKSRMPDRREKVINWDYFEAHMLAAWIRLFEPNDPLALSVARMWGEIITRSFEHGSYCDATYAAEYRMRIPALHRGERLIEPSQFYMVHLLKGMLDTQTESFFVEYLLQNPHGIYYVYGSKITVLPDVFASRNTSFYLAALEQIAGYGCAKEKLRFVAEWLLSNKGENGEWDMGPKANDGVYFPLSESWRRPETRRHDCTARIQKLLKALS